MVTDATLQAPLVASWRRWLPPIAILVLGVDLALVLAVAGSTHGYDLQAYLGAAHRVLDGLPLYDPSIDVAGGFGIYQYPPPFALLLVPLALVPPKVALWTWTAALVASFLAGTAILPVRRDVRWAIVLLGGLMWPLLYAIKLGQVGPLLYLAFAIGWRCLDRPVPVGLSIAAGTIVKVQPVLLLGWAVVTRRFRAAAVAVGALSVAAVLATVVLGPGVWGDYLALLGRVSSPVTTPHDFTPGAVAYQLGLSEPAATILQWACVVVTAVVTGYAWWRASAEVAYVVTIVASQLVSPLLWDHYAILLLLPVAWLLERRAWWAGLIPLALALPAVWITPSIAYPICFGSMLVAPLLEERRETRGSALRSEEAHARATGSA